jgi:uncharacterized protein (DUF1800 family)
MAIPQVSSSLKKYHGKWNKQQATHLLKRTMFGAKKEDIDYFASKSLRHSIDELIDTVAETPAPPLNHYADDKFTDPDVVFGETWIKAAKQQGGSGGRRKNSLKAWWIGLMLNQNRSIQEKMVLFWHNHFSTQTETIELAISCYKYNVLLRDYALGNFKQMVRNISVDAGMLRYLNGNNNVKKAPDENYGRELQELFTIGKGPGSHYTEADVKAAARVLTGFRIDPRDQPNTHGVFDSSRHDETDKQFSAFYNNKVIKGRKGKDGEKELDELVDMIFEQEEVSKFICRKLYRFFVYHDIDETTEKNIITPLAKTFRKNNYEIKPVLKKLFSSKHFFDDSNKAAIIKSPVDFTIGLCREFNVEIPEDTDLKSTYQAWLILHNNATQLQQNVGDPPNVAGWQAYYQEPLYDKIWINSDTLPKRNVFSDRMLSLGFARNNKRFVADPLVLTAKFSHPEDPDALIDESIEHLLMTDLPAEEKKYMKESILLSGLQGEMSNHYWTDAWNKLTNKPDDIANKKSVQFKLQKMYQHIMNLPQYQLM